MKLELKTGKITHQDLGQMQMYVNYYDRIEKLPDENPTIGILLCTSKNDTVVKMTLPQDNKTILPKEYQIYLPTLEKGRVRWKSHFIFFTFFSRVSLWDFILSSHIFVCCC
ncbi:DUF1016 family protein [bacterium]|nr:DUF1016 family protein [bacterium]